MFERLRTTTALAKVWKQALFRGVYSCLAVIKERSTLAELADIPSGIEAAVSIALGLLLAFRANRAYERWWEARTLWGALVNASRNLAVKIREMVDLDPVERSKVCTLIVAFCYCLRDHLRGGASVNKLPGLADVAETPQHVPSWIVRRLYARFHHWQAQSKLSMAELLVIDREALRLLDVCGGCEKIKNTPIARSYGTFVHHCIFIFLVTLPWGLVNDFRLWTIPIVIITSYVIIAAEEIARFVGEPFGEDEDNLDLDTICTVIDASVTEILEG